MMALQGQVQRTVHAFVTLLLDPFEQDLNGAVRAAATAVTLTFALGAFVSSDKVEAYTATLVLLLLCVAFTAVTNRGGRRIAVSRNLGVASLWLAVTQLLVLLGEMVVPNILQRDLRFAAVFGALLVLVPIHIFGNLAFWPAMGMTLMLLLTTTTLTWLLIY